MPDTVAIDGERTIDVRELNARIRHTVILQLVDNLERGKALQVIADHSPEPLRLQLEARYGESRGWTYLEKGPDIWRVRVERAYTQSRMGDAGRRGSMPLPDNRRLR